MTEAACSGHCACSMWEKDGVQYRKNELTRDNPRVPLHAHYYDHTARIVGTMLMTVDAPGQALYSRTVQNEDIFIPAWHKHTFELTLDINETGEVICFWDVLP